MSSAHIALVDDDRLVLASLGDCLTAAGYQVSTFRSGEAALSGLWDTHVDLLVADLLLPGMSGFDLASELRSRPKCRTTPVVAISALTWGERLARHPAIDDLLPKPVDHESLLFCVRALLDAAPLLDASWAETATVPARAPAGRVRLEVKLSSAAECVTEFTQNLAHDGLFIRTYDPLPPETEVEVSLGLPFLSQPALLHGRVVRIVPLDGADARLVGPGMGIALTDVPRELKLSLRAYVAGVRDGTGLQPVSSPRARRVLLAGLDTRLPPDALDFLTRAGLTVERCARLGEALLAVQQLHPDLVVVAAELLGATAGASLLSLREHGAHSVLAIATPDLAAQLEGRCEVLEDAEPPPLFDSLCIRLGVARRACERVRWNTNVSTVSAEGRTEGMLENLSLGGLLMSTPRSLAVGERFMVEFALPEEGRISGLARAVRVARVKPEDPRLRVGVAFERLDDDSPERLRRFIEARAGSASVLH
ncbi:MAG: PilZ domain-containing protein [Myxococcales bacterium]